MSLPLSTLPYLRTGWQKKHAIGTTRPRTLPSSAAQPAWLATPIAQTPPGLSLKPCPSADPRRLKQIRLGRLDGPVEAPVIGLTVVNPTAGCDELEH
jgi:hypothetical protein